MAFLISFTLVASEGDAFTARLHSYEDMNEVVSFEIERLLTTALYKANKKNHHCDENIALKAIEGELLRPFVGVVESWASRSPEVVGQYIPYKESVYRDVGLFENLPAHLGKIGMGKFFRIKDTVISSDKLAHFLDIGHNYFELINQEGQSLEAALLYGIDAEKGMYGLKTTKIFSYADLVANLHGYEFWNSLFNDRFGNDYITCEKDKFVLRRVVSLDEYVDDGWDEAVNCSSYANAEIAEKINKRISELEAKFGKKLQCPSEKGKCEGLLNKYQDKSGYLISPLCY